MEGVATPENCPMKVGQNTSYVKENVTKPNLDLSIGKSA